MAPQNLQSMTRAEDAEQLEALVGALRREDLGSPEVALVLGSGLGAFADALEGARAIPYGELEGMPTSAVPGHAGRLVVGKIDGTEVLVQQGRVHLYEGWHALEVTRAVRAFGALGCGAVVLTNAAGGLRKEWPAGTLMRITDHVDLQRRPLPLRGETTGGSPYDRELGAVLDATAERESIRLERGVYCGLMGPSYESPAEVRFLGKFGGDAVGMSTVAEARAARAVGLRVAAVSCITNPGAGLSDGPLNHEEVVEAGQRVAGDFSRLLSRAIPGLAQAAKSR